MLTIENLHVTRDDKPILQGLNLHINAGEIHAIMGPNGAGKSTLGYVLAGRPGYEVTQGRIHFMGQDLLALDVSARAHLGLFLAMQYPVELPGVNNTYFLRAAYNEVRKAHGEPLVDAFDFMALIREKMAVLGMDEKLLGRGVNEGFSGGEKKRNEILQLLLLKPKLAVLDETDSGLDIDALQWVAKGVNYMRDAQRSFIMITHYQRLLNYVTPDFVHVLYNGRIVKSGGKELALLLEEKGYGWLTQP